MAAALFGGFCVTGTIARTATNVRAGSRGPVSGMLHAVFVLLFMLIAAPLAGFIPLAALAAVLAVVAWNMIEREAAWHLIRTSRADAVVLLATFGLVVFRDLTEGIVVGFALGGLVFIRRMSDSASVDTPTRSAPADCAVYHLHGPYFFGAAAKLGEALDNIADHPHALVLDLEDVPFIDSTGARSFELMVRKIARAGGVIYLTGTRPEVAQALRKAGVTEPHALYLPDMDAVDAARARTR
jgi:SulP family sulfate permease